MTVDVFVNSDGMQMISIPYKEYESLLDDRKWRIALEAGGVDHWEWYTDSLAEAGYYDD